MGLMKTTIFFDYDGVIVDSIATTAPILTALAARFGKTTVVTPEKIRTHWGNGWQQFYKTVMELTDEEIPLTIPHYQELVQKQALAPGAFPDIERVLHDLGTTHALHIVSGNFSDIITANMSRLGLLQHFGRVFGNNEVGGLSKHDPEFYLIPARALGVPPAEIILLGDTIDEIHGGKAAAITVISCAWGWTREAKLREAEPDHLAKDPQELLEIVRRLP
ncbi:MAG: hypothetical protein A3I44_03880 [Candidatus Sungbacteria bacterium RIFCSPLOWO2_02_FULL_51_17]|uniref:HAD family hydrolase n=1 Tax=Candidatus Sungbacteria bacterium RIFCSPHIGHO2_02_FULL_51_29 TaxID=1802273 RepID=A0A1G2KS33_9BACT|nr:MAG: hypothetical protein A2676_02400 [Candidatus Sungbacteria bacterium RIFCSPHIGHO2_01_FULL_51_22]OHA02257.1 MAG: hypothetical protein A3C16_04130 [Candidatus Sungbacteria bacterium RIFCSPHIGHO2_02_FULL_51_29]OHA06668.1 MAG: hypothetical protein A3B29_03105 [Candidatus Sungbacteria bacterium RIFCSPLOWO2_01_FULL_51_34]OHA11226.1 MAG: hypothetical protein A3I44_03880 [Candidatus Sungbacteria bacterium RIFCSPLOWO2_02_FULL_51_17]